MVAVAQW